MLFREQYYVKVFDMKELEQLGNFKEENSKINGLR